MKKTSTRRHHEVSSTKGLVKLPKDVSEFLHEIIHQFSLGHRDEQFARWAAVKASFILEYRDLLY